MGSGRVGAWTQLQCLTNYNRSIFFLRIYSLHSAFIHGLRVPRGKNISKALSSDSGAKRRLSDYPAVYGEERKRVNAASQIPAQTVWIQVSRRRVCHVFWKQRSDSDSDWQTVWNHRSFPSLLAYLCVLFFNERLCLGAKSNGASDLNHLKTDFWHTVLK